jgi:hypothetical protein
MSITTTARTCSNILAISQRRLTYTCSEAGYIIRADETLDGFFAGCVASPDNCPLARSNKTAQQLKDDFYDFTYKLKYSPLSDGFNRLFRYSDLKAQLRNSLYTPGSWHRAAAGMDALYRGNLTEALLAMSAIRSPVTGLTTTPEANFGIRGADKTVRVKSLEEWKPYLAEILGNSQSMGDISAYAPTTVAQWLSKAVEVYSGDFRAKTKNPVLLASNTFDPFAPLEAAQRMSGLLEGSALLLNNGYGVRNFSQLTWALLTGRL